MFWERKIIFGQIKKKKKGIKGLINMIKIVFL